MMRGLFYEEYCCQIAPSWQAVRVEHELHGPASKSKADYLFWKQPAGVHLVRDCLKINTIADKVRSYMLDGR
jgi:hypothetical protein